MSEAIELAKKYMHNAGILDVEAFYKAVLELGIQRGRELERAELSKQEPVGYLPSYELDRLSSGHDARLRTSKFGASALDGDMPLYAEPMNESLKTLRQLEKENKELRDKIAIAYGYLWHVNNEPCTPYQYPPERAAYEARKILRDTMSHEQRGEGIEAARELMSTAPKETNHE